MQFEYDPQAIESETQSLWEKHNSFRAEENSDREKFYCLSMFPYPSGRLHMGHVRNYTIGDVISRFQRMQGKNVLQPMGWDAFGLPAENAAIKHAVPPAKWTRENIDYMRAQLKRLGFAYDWSREIATCDPGYYRWEQWLFTRLMKKGLVYRKNSIVNWDPVDQTVLANEQVIDGRGWRSGALVEQREIPQWFLKITDYADELLEGLDKLESWPDSVKTMQRNWIGRSRGLEIEFDVPGENAISVFTTRPDTLMGVTYLAIAAGHPLAQKIAASHAAIAAFIKECQTASVAESDLETQEKKGIALGCDAIHPITGESVPIWIANFVLMSYGTGAVMSVPAHDKRDYYFARLYNLPIKPVVVPKDWADKQITHSSVNEAVGNTPFDDLRYAPCLTISDGDQRNWFEWDDRFAERGICFQSGEFTGLDFEQSFQNIAGFLTSISKGQVTINYRLRDWGVSRQRYWGCPIPVIYCDTCGSLPVPEAQLPVVLPEDVTVKGGASPLTLMSDWIATACPQCGKPARRETDTFDTFFESSWYYARFACADLNSAMLDDRARYWAPVDQYIGGIEHAILHLLYARFFHKLMRDEGLLASDEPFVKLLTQGMVLAECFYRRDEQGAQIWYAPTDVEIERNEQGRIVGGCTKSDGQALIYDGMGKMSKSKNNGIDPQVMIARYGADTVRLFMMFASPPEQSLEWSDAGVEGAFRFLKRLWRQVHNHVEQGAAPALSCAPLTVPQKDIRCQLHDTIAKLGDDFSRRLTFNTAVAAVMELLNGLARFDGVDDNDRAIRQECLQSVTLVLAPIVPHICQALWEALGQQGLVINQPWPAVDDSARVRDTQKIAVQVNGKLRGEIEMALACSREELQAAALACESVQRHLGGAVPVKVIIVPGRLVNLVIANKS